MNDLYISFALSCYLPPPFPQDSCADISFEGLSTETETTGSGNAAAIFGTTSYLGDISFHAHAVAGTVTAGKKSKSPEYVHASSIKSRILKIIKSKRVQNAGMYIEKKRGGVLCK